MRDEKVLVSTDSFLFEVEETDLYNYTILAFMLGHHRWLYVVWVKLVCRLNSLSRLKWSYFLKGNQIYKGKYNKKEKIDLKQLSYSDKATIKGYYRI